MIRNPDRDRSWHTWRYLSGGAVKHALAIEEQPFGNMPAICSVGPVWYAPPDQWLGTGTQAEYERVATLPECKRCTRLLSPDVTL